MTRWRRYGKDRLYVSTVDGARAGWHDLVTAETHVEAAADRDDVLRAIASWQGTDLVGPAGPRRL